MNRFTIVKDEQGAKGYYLDGTYIGHETQVDVEYELTQLGLIDEVVVTPEWVETHGFPTALADVDKP